MDEGRGNAATSSGASPTPGQRPGSSEAASAGKEPRTARGRRTLRAVARHAQHWNMAVI